MSSYPGDEYYAMNAESERRKAADWTLDDGRIIRLVTPDEFDALPDGTTLIAIDGETVVKGTDHIDDDTRFGYLAFGVER